MEDNAGLVYLINGVAQEAKNPIYVDAAAVRAAYEVLRIIRGVPLFYEDHFNRLKGTFDVLGVKLEMDAGQLRGNIRKLLQENKLDNCNVKVVVYNEASVQQQLIYISKSYYPTEEEIDEGIMTGLLQIERHNPNAKIINQTYKDTVNAKMQECGYKEIILADNNGRITEGSKSNAFFVRDGAILTAPGEYVLKGITRKYVIEACKNAGFRVSEQFVAVKDLSLVEGAFLSGTSIKVLPVKRIDQFMLNSSAHPVIKAVRREYNKLLEKYIEDNVKIW